MKTRVKTIFSVSLLTLLLTMAPVAVLAHEGEEHSEDIAQNTSVGTQEEKVDPAALKARLEERKATLKTRIDAVKQARIKTRCKASQGTLSSVSGRIKGLETSRTHVYENLLSRLTKVSTNLKEKGVDTTKLDSEIAKLTELIATFKTDLAAYTQAVADLKDMDCVADPTAFQASLEAARTARTKVAEDAQAIRSYITDTIKVTIAGLRSSEAKEPTTGETN